MAETADEQTLSGGPGGERPSLVVVCGLPGVGKSRVARELADRLSATVFRTDEIRKELFDDPAYTDDETERVYAELLDRALTAVDSGDRAVLDGTYRCERFRSDVAAGADRHGIDCAFIKVECPEPVVRERIAARADDASDAGVEEYYHIRDRFDPLVRPHVTVDNAGDWDSTREQVHAAFTSE